MTTDAGPLTLIRCLSEFLCVSRLDRRLSFRSVGQRNRMVSRANSVGLFENFFRLGTENIRISKTNDGEERSSTRATFFSSDAWDAISAEEKQALGVQATHDGEFWISFDDFFSNFHQLHICHRGPASLATTEKDADTCTWNNLFRVDRLSIENQREHELFFSVRRTIN